MVVAALVLALGVPSPGTAETADVAALQARLDAVTARAQQLAADLERVRAQDGGLRRAVEDLEEARDAARDRLAQRVREVYIATGPLPSGWSATAPTERLLATRGAAGALQVEQELVDAVSEESAAARQLRAQAEEFRARLREQAAEVLAEQDEARALLAAAQARAAEQARAAAQQAQQAADAEAARAAAATAQQQVERAQQALDDVSAVVTTALAPAVTERGRRAAADAAPVLALLEASGAGYPAGYRPTGTVLSGTASWYGPGFVGSPTASGRPYDPERLSCAHRELPLGTVVRVSANGRAISCLVDDRGPYAGDRILDLSRAGSRALGYDGTAEVVAEVLARGG